MQGLIEAVKLSCSQGNWYSALYIALTLPDICAKLENPSSKGSGKRYRDWFDKYLKQTYKSEFHGPDFYFLTSRDIWALRCSLLHEGTDEISNQKSQEVLRQIKFTLNSVHRIKDGDVLVLNVDMFCNEMLVAVQRWIHATASDTAIQDRIADMVIIETGGFRSSSSVWIAASDEFGDVSN